MAWHGMHTCFFANVRQVPSGQTYSMLVVTVNWDQPCGTYPYAAYAAANISRPTVHQTNSASDQRRKILKPRAVNPSSGRPPHQAHHLIRQIRHTPSSGTSSIAKFTLAMMKPPQHAATSGQQCIRQRCTSRAPVRSCLRCPPPSGDSRARPFQTAHHACVHVSVVSMCPCVSCEHVSMCRS